ncbi:LOW QUALITY PROTEIN: hypothetical protein MSG28_003776, partial [Choristoneura fumiferana]
MTDMPPYLAVKDEEKDSGQGDSESASELDDWDLPLSYDKPRHLEPIKGAERVEHSWRVKEKYKTHCVALVLCLNVGVDAPDVVKTQPCARLECWIEPEQGPGEHRARAAAPVKKLCCSLRRNAKDERVLFHYNGHGVPKPTSQGEIWVFNRTWMGAPSLYVYDCSNAGVIVDNFRAFADQHERDYELNSKSAESPAPAAVSYKNCIQLGACAAGQTLPMSPELPADLFTACLTTPVKMAMKWFVLRHSAGSATAAAAAQRHQNLHDLIDNTLHRVRALQLLCRFLSLGARAVRAVLAVGIFPYMLKLLQASAHDLRASMVYIWAKIIAVDPTCQVDLVNAKGHKYFLSILSDSTVDSEHRTLAAYVLAGIVDNYPAGQEAAQQLGDGSPLLRQWACICLGRLWRGCDAARWAGVRDLAHEKLYPLLREPHPEVRAACAFALGTFVAAGGCWPRTEHANALDQQVGAELARALPHDASPLVRAEILHALQWLVLIFEQHFIAVYIQERMRKSDRESLHGGTGPVDHGQDALGACGAGGAGGSASLPPSPNLRAAAGPLSPRDHTRTLPHPPHSLVSLRGARLETQAFHSRCALPPAVVLFHPYDQHIALASKDNFGIWDWGTAAKLCVGSWRKAWGRVTALAYLNAHERALLAVASHAGHLAVYSGEMQVWLLSDVLGGAGAGGAGAGAGGYSAPPPTLLRWCARRRHLALAGLAGSGAGAGAGGAGDGGPWSLVAGFADGSLRAWDERAPGAQAALHHHRAPVLCCAPRHARHKLVTGWSVVGGGVAGGGGRGRVAARVGRARARRAGRAAPPPRARAVLRAATRQAQAGHRLWGGGSLVAGVADGSLRAWDERAPGAQAALHHHRAPVLCCAPRHARHKLWGGGSLVAGVADGSLRAWDERAPGAQAALHHHRAPVLCCAPRHARHKLVTGWSVVGGGVAGGGGRGRVAARVGRARARRAGRAAPPPRAVLCCAPRHARHKLVTGWSVGGGGGSLVAGVADGSLRAGTSARPARRPRCTTTARRAVLRAATRQAQAGHRLVSSGGGGSLVAGVADGSLRAWDERAPGAQAALHHHRAPVLCCAPRHARHKLVTGWSVGGGGSLVAGVADGSLRAWDERAPVLCCAPRHARHKLWGGGSLVAGVADGSLRAWDERAPGAQAALHHHRAPVLCCAPRHARHKLVTGWSVVGGGGRWWGGRGRVAARVGRARARRAGRAAPPPRARAVLRAATRQAQAGHRLVSSGGGVAGGGVADGSLRAWDERAPGAQAALHHHRAPVLCCAPRHARHKLVTGWSVGGGGGSLVAGVADGSLRAWDERAPGAQAALHHHRAPVLCCAPRHARHKLVTGWSVVGGGGSLVAGVADGSLRAWDERAPGAQAALHHTARPCCAARRDTPGTSWSPAGRAAPPPRARAVLRAATRQAQAGHRLVSRGGGGSLVAGFADGSLRAWDERAPGAQAALHHHRAPVLCCAPRHARHKLVTGWSVGGGGGSLVAGVADGSLRAWDERAPGAQAALHHHRAPVLSGGGGSLVAGVADGSLRAWDERAPGAQAALHHHRAPVLCCAPRHARHKLVTGWSVVGGGGSLVAGVADGSLRAWDERAPGAQAALHHHRALVLCCAPRHARHKLVTGWSVVGGGGSLVAGVADGSLRAWDERAPGAQAALHHHRAPVLCCAPRHARHKLVTGCSGGGGGSLVAGVADGSLRAWDERAPGAQAALHHHRAPVLCCAPRHARHKLVTGWGGGGSLVAGVADGSLRAWDERAPGAQAALHHHRAPVLCCAPRHARHKLGGGGSLVAGVADGSLRAWDERAPGAQAALHHHRAPVLCCAPRHARHKLVTGWSVVGGGVAGGGGRGRVAARVGRARARRAGRAAPPPRAVLCCAPRHARHKLVTGWSVVGGGSLVAGVADGSLRAWDERAPGAQAALHHHRAPVLCCAPRHARHKLWGGGRWWRGRGRVAARVGRARARRAGRAAPPPRARAVLRAATRQAQAGHRLVSSGGGSLVAGVADGSLRAWDERAPGAQAALHHHRAPVLCCAPRHARHKLVTGWSVVGGGSLVAGVADGSLRAWTSARPARRPRCTTTARPSGGGSLVAGVADGSLRAWDERAPGAQAALHHHRAPVLCCAPRHARHKLVTGWSVVGGGSLVAGVADGSLRAWDERAPGAQAALHHHARPCCAARRDTPGTSWSPAGRAAPPPRARAVLRAATRQAQAGHRLVSSGGGRWWRGSRTGRCARGTSARPARRPRCTTTARRAVLRAATRQAQAGHRLVSSGGGGSLVAGVADGSLRAWDERAPGAQAALHHHRAPVLCCAPRHARHKLVTGWSGGGGSLVAGVADGSLRAWDERAPGAQAALHHHRAPVLCCAPRHARHKLVTGCMNGEIRIYDTRAMDAPAETLRAPGPLAAVAVHPLLDLIACYCFHYFHHKLIFINIFIVKVTYNFVKAKELSLTVIKIDVDLDVAKLQVKSELSSDLESLLTIVETPITSPCTNEDNQMFSSHSQQQSQQSQQQFECSGDKNVSKWG